MSRLLGPIAARLRKFAGERRRFPRYKTQRRVRLIFDLSAAELKSGAGATAQHQLTFAGRTRDLSETGLAIFVNSLSVGGYDLGVVGRAVRVDLELPTGPVHISAAVVRYERLRKKRAEGDHLIAVRITEMSDREWVRLVRYMRTVRGA